MHAEKRRTCRSGRCRVVSIILMNAIMQCKLHHDRQGVSYILSRVAHVGLVDVVVGVLLPVRRRVIQQVPLLPVQRLQLRLCLTNDYISSCSICWHAAYRQWHVVAGASGWVLWSARKRSRPSDCLQLHEELMSLT
jgi:hypothetical protein